MGPGWRWSHYGDPLQFFMDQMWGCQGTSQYQYVCGDKIICFGFNLRRSSVKPEQQLQGKCFVFNKEENQSGQVLCKLGECSLIDVNDVQADKFLPSIDDNRYCTSYGIKNQRHSTSGLQVVQWLTRVFSNLRHCTMFSQT